MIFKNSERAELKDQESIEKLKYKGKTPNELKKDFGIE